MMEHFPFQKIAVQISALAIPCSFQFQRIGRWSIVVNGTVIAKITSVT